VGVAAVPFFLFPEQKPPWDDTEKPNNLNLLKMCFINHKLHVFGFSNVCQANRQQKSRKLRHEFFCKPDSRLFPRNLSTMSLRGVKQLKELVIRYSDYDGSSRGIREWMGNNLLNFAKQNANLQIKTELKRAKHPLLIGQYENGNSKTICIKNLDVSTIESQVSLLRNQIGRRVSAISLILCQCFMEFWFFLFCHRWDQQDIRSQLSQGLLAFKENGTREWI
jgi:hypothetical protein